MTLRPGAIAVLVVVLVVIVGFALRDCGGGSKGGQPTDIPLPTNVQGTPYSFAEFRDQFVSRLDAIGPNIGYVPPDVRQELLAQCREIALYVRQDAVTPLCDAISRAMDENDPDLLDVTIRQLQALEDN